MLPTLVSRSGKFHFTCVAIVACAVGCSSSDTSATDQGFGGDDASATIDASPERRHDASRGGDGSQGGDASHSGDASTGGDASKSMDASTGGDASTAPDGGGDASGGGGSDGGSVLPLPSPLHGVTVDDISNLSSVVGSLSALPHKPTARIVFDENQQPSYYAKAVPAIHGVAYVMGEILDSAYVKNDTVTQYTQRTSAYLAAFPTGVDLWEVGNEINGNWLGNETDVANKMTGAFDLVKAAGGKTELTLYGCSDSGQTYDMFTWVNAHVPARMLTGLDYVLVSYYEGDCGAPRSDWTSVFQQLRALFPTAGLGFGEVGYTDKNGNDIALQNVSAATTYLQKYYLMQVPVSGYVGGYFWWYFAEDMVPKTQPLFPVLSAAMQ
ncbi:MAG TPA: hypothetical protein VF765_34400 [Polyangiaceae bacterium]